jgi:hypothetical protein
MPPRAYIRNTLTRSARLRQYGGLVSRAAFDARRAYLLGDGENPGPLKAKVRVRLRRCVSLRTAPVSGVVSGGGGVGCVAADAPRPCGVRDR